MGRRAAQEVEAKRKFESVDFPKFARERVDALDSSGSETRASSARHAAPLALYAWATVPPPTTSTFYFWITKAIPL